MLGPFRYGRCPRAPEKLPEPETEGVDMGFDVESDRHDGRIALVGGRVVTMRNAREQREVIDIRQLWSQTDVVYSPTFVVFYGGLMGEEYFYDRYAVWKDERLLNFVPKFIVHPRSICRPTAPDEHYNHIFAAMLNGRLYEAATMNQLLPESIEREPLFFEREGGDAWMPEAMERIQRLISACEPAGDSGGVKWLPVKRFVSGCAGPGACPGLVR